MSKSIRLDNVRLSYEHIFTPSKFDEGQDAKYSATFIIPKNHPQIGALKKAMFEAGKEMFATEFAGKEWPRGFTCSLKDADVEVNSMGEVLSDRNPAYKGCYILDANSTKRPPVYNRDRSLLTEEDGVVYSGCYVNALIGIKGYTFGKVKRGVKCYLNGVQFNHDGERFGSDTSDAFDDLGSDDDWAN